MSGQKKNLRKDYLQKRADISPTAAQEWSIEIKNLFFRSFSLANVSALHIFLPIVHKVEINTWLIIDELRLKYPSIKIIISKTNKETCTLENYVFDNNTKLTENEWGIPEPEPQGNFVEEKEIDMVLIPLLAFDLMGHRVGYGKGFYDRFLSLCRGDVTRIGLCFFDPVSIIEDVAVTDIPMDFCITPKKVYKF